MADVADLLVEIGSEELPPRSLRELELAFATGVASGLVKSGLGGGTAISFATPRRLAVRVPAVARRQPVQSVEKRGPPVKVAFDGDGKPTRAAEAFASGCGIAVSALERLETNGGAWLVYRGQVPGQPAAELVPGIVQAALDALPIARRMRWGSRDTEFVRPVHWVVLLHGDEVIAGEVLGLRAGNITHGHRSLSVGPITIRGPGAYERQLEDEGFVVAGFEDRRGRVRSLATELARELGGEAVLEADVLDEVTALVEWPVPVAGSFDPAYLRLPEEVLTATLQGHQRYFPLRGPDGRLLARFVAMSNLRSTHPDEIRRGNERVVKPRLADAVFFYDHDRARPLAARHAALASVVFQRGLGSLQDRSARMAALCRPLAAATGADETLARRAAFLAKTDLLTDLVREFPELQGRMGRYYALADQESPAVAEALDEQYWPRQAGGAIPRTPVGRCIALADRLDTLAGVFALGKRPSGNKDPFGLRRAALGTVRTLVEGGIELDLPAVLADAVGAQPVRNVKADAVVAELYDFVIERMRAWYLEGLAPGFAAGEVTPEMFEAVRARAPASPLDFHERLKAVRTFTRLPEAGSLAVANKRIANILRGAADEAGGSVDPALFQSDEERRLEESVAGIAARQPADLAARRYEDVLRRLAGLREPVDRYFDAVMVMAKEAGPRRNRLAQLQRVRALFLDVADLSCLPSP